MAKSKIVMIGAGHLGSLILKEWINKKILGVKDISLHLNSKKSLKSFRKEFPKLQISCVENKEPLPSGDIYVVAVKPQQWAELKNELKPKIKKNSLIVSIMAGIPPSRIESEMGCAAIVAMTNTSLQVGEALSSLYKSPKAKNTHLKWARDAFAPFGMISVLDENDFAAATALGASHPAFAIWILNEISKIIQKKLPSENGMDWTLNVFKGAAKLIKKKKNVPAILEQIATPGGCTAEGLSALEQLEIAQKLLEVFERCQTKAQGLGK